MGLETFPLSPLTLDAAERERRGRGGEEALEKALVVAAASVDTQVHFDVRYKRKGILSVKGGTGVSCLRMNRHFIPVSAQRSYFGIRNNNFCLDYFQLEDRVPL